MRFTSKGAASKFFSTIESTSSNVSAAINGFGGVYLAEIEGSLGFQDKQTSQNTVKSSSTSVSVLQHYSMTMKQFQIEEDKMNLTVMAQQHAIEIGKDGAGTEKARSFMKLFGSHVPSGVHKLGGIFCSIADAESDTQIETTKFTEAAETRLKSQISGGYLGGAFVIGGSMAIDHSSSLGKAEASQTKKDNVAYRFSVEVIGPLASNPETFEQFLAYDSTWAIIDRGPPEGYLPVWHLLRRQGNEFQSAADILEKTWNEDEKKQRKKWEEKIQIVKSDEGTKKQEQEEGKKMEKIEKELQERKKEFLARVGNRQPQGKTAHGTVRK